MQRSCLPLTAKERVQLPCRTAEPSQPEGNRQGGPDNMHPARGGATGAQAPAQGTGRGHLATQEPREPEPGLWASLCARNHDAAHGTAPARPLRAISCRTVSGTGRGAGVTGTGRAYLGPDNQATRVGPIQREAPTCRRTDKQGSGRREAERERRPADGVGYRQGWAPTTHNTGEAGRRPHRAISCRTVSGTGRGAGSRPTGLSRAGPIRREAPFLPQHPICRFPAEALSGGRRMAADAQ